MLSACANIPSSTLPYKGKGARITWTTHHMFSDWALDMTLSPDGNLLAVGSRFEHIRLFNTKTRVRVNIFSEHEGSIDALDFSGDGHYLVSAGSDQIIRIWDVNRAKVIRRFKGHSQRIIDVRFSPNGKVIASTSKDMTVRLWDVKTGKQMHIFNDNIMQTNNNKMYAHDLSFSVDGLQLAAVGDTDLKLWQVTSGELLIHHKEVTATDIEFSLDGNYYAVNGGSEQSMVSVWSAHNHLPIAHFKTDYPAHKSIKGKPPHIRFTPDNKKILFIAELPGGPEGYQRKAIYWHFKNTNKNTYSHFQTGFNNNPLSGFRHPIFSPDNKTLITSNVGYPWSSHFDPVIRFWNTDTGKEIFPIKPVPLTAAPAYRKRITGSIPFCVSPDGKKLRNTAGIFDLSTFNLTPITDNDRLRSVAISHNSLVHASGTDNGDITLRSMVSNRVIASINIHEHADANEKTYAKIIIFDQKDEKLLVLSNINTLTLYDIMYGKQLWIVKLGKNTQTHAVAVTKDNNTFFIGTSDTQKITINPYDLSTGNLRTNHALKLAM